MSLVAECTYDDFKADLIEAEVAKECRYAVYDADYSLKDGQKRSKLVFFLWWVTPGLLNLNCYTLYACATPIKSMADAQR